MVVSSSVPYTNRALPHLLTADNGTKEKVLVRPANMPGIWGIPDIDLMASLGSEHDGR
jgi:hypothetical protein